MPASSTPPPSPVPPPDDTDPSRKASGSSIRSAREEAEELKRRNVATDSFPGYRILRRIHQGGQGVVYEAVQESTGGQVAIKVMHQGPFATGEDRSRFDREVRILGAINHPNIVAVRDAGNAHGSDYFVMDYIHGEALDVAGASTKLADTVVCSRRSARR